MTASTYHKILLLLTFGVLAFFSSGCAVQNTEQAKYPDETDYKQQDQKDGKLGIKAPKISHDNYHAFLDSY
jgi:hypothetical protein